VNFAGGTVILVAAAIIHVAIVGAPRAFPAEAWLYLGGVTGVTYIFLSAALVVHTGVLLLGLGAVAGQLVTAFALDVIWPGEVGQSWVTAMLMIAVAGAGVIVAAAPWRRR
jgi:Protein of unknown function, DUF606.